MMWKFIVFGIILKTSIAWGHESDFYANGKVQAKYPGAFATQEKNLPFHQELASSLNEERQLLVQKIKENHDLHSNILRFETIPIEEQITVLLALFRLECEVLKITPPELIIDEVSIPGYAYFEFDYETGGAGKVYLNLKKLRETANKSEFIILLLHETRHSVQFQNSQLHKDHVSKGFKESFIAQREFKKNNIRLSFCDFMLLLNEYEAFQFANYIYGALTAWKSPINDMGTLASQFDEHGSIRLNILDIFTTSEQDPIEVFNALEVKQYEVIHD